jgi:hypothetical protein
MAKGKRHGGRSSRPSDDNSSSSSQDEHVDTDARPSHHGKVTTQQDFKERREIQRRDAAQKRRAKQRCHLCGMTGHVRRGCPGFEDDGRGESKFTKAKGDNVAGVNLKTSSRGKTTTSKPSSKSTQSHTMIAGLDLPEGFGPIDEIESTENNGDENDDSNSPFYYYDTMCNGSATLQFLQNGRTGAIFQKTKEEALQEYCRIRRKSIITSNLGGCIAQIYLKTNQSWTANSSLPLPWSELDPFPVLLVIGINPGYDCLDEHRELARTVLQTACADMRRVVGLCATLDYSTGESSQSAQMARVLCTCEVAMAAEIPLQLKLLRVGGQEDRASPYSQMLKDLCTILETHPALKVHLCSWTGLADDMMAFLQRFPDRLWFGLDGSVTFAKAVSSHECAFDIPLDRLLLETGSNIPTPVAIALGRQAFPHCGLIPYIAAAVAKHKRNSSARNIARAASRNASELYQLMKHTDVIKNTSTMVNAGVRLETTS